jgi:LPXTG-motif cell wall-anchored protein
MNGEGDGQATGKPCAGCVGKADNKNPKGQYPDGSDANNGYECDGNNGIGKSNPAHTGCTSGSVSPDGSEPGQSCPPDSEECVLPTTTEDSPGEVLGVQAERDPAANRPAAEVAPASSGLLPETGAGRYGIPIVAGLALLGAGAALVARKRPQTGR